MLWVRVMEAKGGWVRVTYGKEMYLYKSKLVPSWPQFVHLSTLPWVPICEQFDDDVSTNCVMGSSKMNMNLKKKEKNLLLLQLYFVETPIKIEQGSQSYSHISAAQNNELRFLR